MTDGSSPGTSLISSVTTRAGAQAAAKRPPLIADRCLRTQFISEIVAPLLSNSLLIRCLSASSKPSAGSVNKDDPPPEIRHTTKSLSVSPSVMASMRRVASRPAASGTGWAASTTSMREATELSRGGVWSYRVITSPDIGASCGHSASNACAIAPEALPAPNTSVRPCAGGVGKKSPCVWAGKARRTAAQYRNSRNACGACAGLGAARFVTLGWDGFIAPF